MSMAEPRTRRKWTLNPRGTHWANDETKYGQKLMEKMGWSKGSGLGREEQGMTEHLALKFKDDSKGIGYKGSDDEWIKHYEGFENVLASLNSQENTATNIKHDSSDNTPEMPDHSSIGKTSLESSSKASRVRVHYHKFTRGKDLSRCTEDDLGCILGSKRAKQLAREKSLQETEKPVDEVGHVDHSMGVTTIKGCSMQDYFAQKMEALRNRAKNQPQILAEEEDGLSPGLGLSTGLVGNSIEPPHDCQEDREEGKKKKKRKTHRVETEGMNSATTEPRECSVQVENNIPKKKKKKRPKNSEVEATNGSACEDNEAKTEEMNSAGTEPEKCLAVENNIPKKKKKRKHQESSDFEVSNISTCEDNHQVKTEEINYAGIESEKCDEAENNVPKKKKKRKCPENAALTATNGNASDSKAVKGGEEDDDANTEPVVNEEMQRKKIKKKHSNTSVEPEEHFVVKKKKKKHTDITNEDRFTQHEMAEENPEKKKRKKCKARA